MKKLLTFAICAALSLPVCAATAPDDLIAVSTPDGSVWEVFYRVAQVCKVKPEQKVTVEKAQALEKSNRSFRVNQAKGTREFTAYCGRKPETFSMR